MDDKITVVVSLTLICIAVIFAPAIPGITLTPELTNIVLPIVTGICGLVTGIKMEQRKNKNDSE